MTRNTAREIAAHLSYELSFTDKTVEELLQERVWGPLGMTRTVLDVDGTQARAIAGGVLEALLHLRQKNG